MKVSLTQENRKSLKRKEKKREKIGGGGVGGAEGEEEINATRPAELSARSVVCSTARRNNGGTADAVGRPLRRPMTTAAAASTGSRLAARRRLC